jgi:hypothetical protein
MANKQNTATGRTEEPVEVFRQFAWHLAGSLAGRTAPPAGKPGKPAGGKRG